MSNIIRSDKTKHEEVILVYSGDTYNLKACNCFQETSCNSDTHVMETFSTMEEADVRVLELGLSPRYVPELDNNDD